MANLIALFELNTMYDVIQFTVFVMLVLFSVLFLGISYWFGLVDYFKKKHGFDSKEKVLTDIVEAKLVETCRIHDEDTRKIMKKCLKIALDD